MEMVIRCSGNVCYVSLKGHFGMECQSWRTCYVGCHVNVADSYAFVGFHSLTHTGDTEFYFPDGNLA